jgi:transcriptional regulator with GAF, ATPase, and Fis domain
MVVLTAIVGILVAIRYLITTRENEVLLREREQSRQEAEHLRLLSTELTTILELDSLLERIVIIATSDLGFDASILILNEKDDHPLYSQSRLMVHAATSSSTESITWRLEDTHLPHSTLLLETEKDVIWIAENIDLPPEVEKWHQEQNIHTTLFMPLKYQGMQLGSLVFANIT